MADRVHLAKNVGEVLERVVQRNHQGLRMAAEAIDEAQAQQAAQATEDVQPAPSLHLPPPRIETSPTQGSPAQQRRLARYEEVTSLAAEGLGPKAIGKHVGLTRQTVARWLRSGSFPERPPVPPRRMQINPLRAISS